MPQHARRVGAKQKTFHGRAVESHNDEIGANHLGGSQNNPTDNSLAHVPMCHLVLSCCFANFARPLSTLRTWSAAHFFSR